MPANIDDAGSNATYAAFSADGQISEEFIITEENRLQLCDRLSEETARFCTNYLPEKKDIIRYRLAVEESLLGWLTPESIGKTLIFKCQKKRFRKPIIELCFKGEPYNPFYESNDQTLGDYGQAILRTLGMAPAYSYKNGINRLVFTIKSEGTSSLKQLLIIIVVAILAGMLGRAFMPEETLAFIQNGFIEPIYNTFLNILGCISGPMIFLSVAWGIYGIGDASTLSKIGKKMIISYVSWDFIAGFAGLLMVPVFGLTLASGTTGERQVADIFELVLDFFPANIVEPFLNGNTMQIIFLAFVVGIALIFLGARTEAVARGVEQINYMIQFIMEIISKLVPYFVFLVIVSLLWSDATEEFSSSWIILLASFAAILIACLVYYLLTSVRLKISFFKLVKKCLPTFVIAIATASSAATFNTNMDICDNRLGIDKSVSSFGVPLAMVIHNPCIVLNYLAVVLYFAHIYDINCSVTWLISAWLLCTILAIATPPIPGGSATVYTMLFVQLGIPSEALGLALALDMISDFFVTAGDMFTLLPAISTVSSKIGMIDRDILEM